MRGMCKLRHMASDELTMGLEVGHRYWERRVLVAETCGELAGLVPPAMVSSLLLSMMHVRCPIFCPDVCCQAKYLPVPRVH